MDTLREHFENMKDEAEKEVYQKLEESSYITNKEFHNAMQKRVAKFEEYYGERNMEPFTRELIEHEFGDFHDRILEDDDVLYFSLERIVSNVLVTDGVLGYDEEEIVKGVKEYVEKETGKELGDSFDPFYYPDED
jgi:deoxyribodipyrimidine photolyase-like uncharacterized protein